MHTTLDALQKMKLNLCLMKCPKPHQRVSFFRQAFHQRLAHFATELPVYLVSRHQESDVDFAQLDEPAARIRVLSLQLLDLRRKAGKMEADGSDRNNRGNGPARRLTGQIILHEDEGINRIEQLLVLRHALEHHTLEQKERLVITPHARNDGKATALARRGTNQQVPQRGEELRELDGDRQAADTVDSLVLAARASRAEDSLHDDSKKLRRGRLHVPARSNEGREEALSGIEEGERGGEQVEQVWVEVARQVGRRRAHGDGVEGVDEVTSAVLLRAV